MRSLKSPWIAVVCAAGVSACATPGAAPTFADKPAARGQPVQEIDLAAWNIDIRTPDGVGLPPGSGSVTAGKVVFDNKCASCHGAAAAGGPMFGTMVGGIGSFKSDRRVLTPGSMYPYAPALFDYIRRAMPLTKPQSLTNEETYAVSAYILHLNGLVPADALMDAKKLTALRMPNRDGFIVDDRPDTRATRCMDQCPPLRAAAF